VSAARPVKTFVSMLVAASITALGLASATTVTHAAPAPQAQEKQSKPDPKKQAGQKQKDEESAAQKELEAKACPAIDVKFDAKTDKTQHPVPTPSSGKAIVFVVRPTMMGNKIQSKLAVDGQWVGGNRGDNYFFVELTPGEHYFCSQAENRSVLAASVEADKTYYMQQKISMGFMKAHNTLVMLDEADGKKDLGKAHLSIFDPKKK